MTRSTALLSRDGREGRPFTPTRRVSCPLGDFAPHRPFSGIEQVAELSVVGSACPVSGFIARCNALTWDGQSSVRRSGRVIVRFEEISWCPGWRLSQLFLSAGSAVLRSSPELRFLLRAR